MTRSIGSSFSNKLDSSSIAPFYAVEIEFSTGTLRVASTYADIVINGATFLGGGLVMKLSPVTETSDTRAQGMEIIFSGLDSTILSAGLNDDSNGTRCNVFFGLLETSSNADSIIDTPYKIFEGFVDGMVLNEGETSELHITVENKLIMLERPTDRRYTHEDQQNLFPGDKSLEFVTSLQDKTIAWGGGTTE